jgi:hypothetical protein
MMNFITKTKVYLGVNKKDCNFAGSFLQLYLLNQHIMKKVFLMVVAAMTIGFVSCGSKNAKEAPADQKEEVVAQVNEVIENATTELATQLEAGDAGKLQAAIEAAKQKVSELLKENPELAKEYLAKVQTFLKENAEKVKAVVGDNAVMQTAIATLTETPAETIISSLQSQINAVGNAGQEAVDAAKTAGQQAVDNAKQTVQEKVDETKQKANEAVDKAVDDAKQKANEKVNEAANKALKGILQ